MQHVVRHEGACNLLPLLTSTVFFDISEHADGGRRGPVADSEGTITTRLAETSPMPPSLDLAPFRRSPSAMRPKRFLPLHVEGRRMEVPLGTHTAHVVDPVPGP